MTTNTAPAAMTVRVNSAHRTEMVLVPTEVPAAQIAALLKSKAADLTWFTRTLRNAYRGAIRNGASYHVGRTATQAHISLASSYRPSDYLGASVDYTVTADGRMFSWAEAPAA